MRRVALVDTNSILSYVCDDKQKKKKLLTNLYWTVKSKISYICVSSIISRGDRINSAMSSLYNFDKSIDQFLAWISETESSVEALQNEIDRLPVRKDLTLRKPKNQLKVSLLFIWILSITHYSSTVSLRASSTDSFLISILLFKNHLFYRESDSTSCKPF